MARPHDCESQTDGADRVLQLSGNYVIIEVLQSVS
jgi:hypothetical protein